MLLGVMLLYVGAVLCVNGIWLYGQARAAKLAPARATPRGEPGGGAIEAQPAAAAVEAHPTFIQTARLRFSTSSRASSAWPLQPP